MINIISSLILFLSMSLTTTIPNLHDIKVKDIDGNTVQLYQFKGKKILIVNVASKCGYTPQYADLQKLQDQFSNTLVIIGFPCNDFGGQEPGSPEDIKTFCTKNYGVTFPIMEKVNIKSEPISYIYSWLTSKNLNGKEDSNVNWNFNKYLINEQGEYVAHFGSGVKPLSKELVEAIQK